MEALLSGPCAQGGGWKCGGRRDALHWGEGRADLSGRAGLDLEFKTCPSRHVSDEAGVTFGPLVSAGTHPLPAGSVCTCV